MNPRFYSGDASEMTGVLGGLDTETLAYIGVRHCPNVEVLPIIQTFPNLLWMKFYNSTIVSWPQEAVVTNQHHPKLLFIFTIRVNFPGGTIPPGLLPAKGAFPKKLSLFTMPNTNFQTLPSDLPEHWIYPLTWYIEFAKFPSFPDVLKRMKLKMLVYNGNQLSSIGADVLMQKPLDALAIRDTNISSLPATGVDITTMTIKSLYMDNTPLTDFPPWMNKAFFDAGRLVQAAGSPICKKIVEEIAIKTSGRGGATPILDARPWLRRVDCTSFGIGKTSFYPVHQEVRAEETW
ncbi:hypothetical protein PINS_up011181 [Pythium insidiosum]|nr:hypothetical protein PINS_up011181 [Pythium insidiosum]